MLVLKCCARCLPNPGSPYERHKQIGELNSYAGLVMTYICAQLALVTVCMLALADTIVCEIPASLAWSTPLCCLLLLCAGLFSQFPEPLLRILVWLVTASLGLASARVLCGSKSPIFVPWIALVTLIIVLLFGVYYCTQDEYTVNLSKRIVACGASCAFVIACVIAIAASFDYRRVLFTSGGTAVLAGFVLHEIGNALEAAPSRPIMALCVFTLDMTAVLPIVYVCRMVRHSLQGGESASEVPFYPESLQRLAEYRSVGQHHDLPPHFDNDMDMVAAEV